MENRLEFDFFIPDNEKKYTVSYHIRNSLNFPYSRLFVEYLLQNEQGERLKKKLTSTYLFDVKTGKPYGQSNLGDIYNHRIDILTNYRFDHVGNHKIMLEQFNRSDTLQGILSVGIRIEYATEESNP